VTSTADRPPGPAGARVWTPADLATYDGPLLLDTHVWLWHVEGDAAQVAPGTTALLDRSGAQARLFVCDISYWEVAVKAAKGKISFAVDAAVWLQRAEQAPGIRFRPLTRPVLLQSTRLAGAAHNDPADRMLIAMAQLDGVPLVTADRLIIDYARAHRGTPVVDVRP
jgi:PIN domain nuclease of toxin-antitoxin system